MNVVSCMGPMIGCLENWNGLCFSQGKRPLRAVRHFLGSLRLALEFDDGIVNLFHNSWAHM